MLLLLLSCMGPGLVAEDSQPADTAALGDADGDGFPAEDDCDDADPFVFPGAAEACDGVDNDCDGAADEDWDQDGDGVAPCAGDCDEGDAAVAEGLPEICDGLDNDCDGVADEGFDEDGDGWTTCRGDCDDGDPDVSPVAEEVCDGADNDCDPDTVEDEDRDGDGYTPCEGDCNDEEPAASPGAAESCDEIDNDCNGLVDELDECWSCTQSGSYLFCATSTDFDGAVAACEGFGGRLVVLEDAAENAAVGTAFATVISGAFWIGLTDAAEEGSWTWIDGTALSYSGWDSSEPNDSGGEDCAHSNWNGAGVWNDIDCDSEYPFACEL